MSQDADETDARALKIMKRNEGVITFQDLYAETCRRYYGYETSVVKYNFTMIDEERVGLGMAKFGVLGVAHGKIQMTLKEFFQ